MCCAASFSLPLSLYLVIVNYATKCFPCVVSKNLILHEYVKKERKENAVCEKFLTNSFMSKKKRNPMNFNLTNGENEQTNVGFLSLQIRSVFL